MSGIGGWRSVDLLLEPTNEFSPLIKNKKAKTCKVWFENHSVTLKRLIVEYHGDNAGAYLRIVNLLVECQGLRWVN